MALDGATLNIIKNDILRDLLDSRIEKIHQPSKDCLVISFRTKEGSKKLLISAGSSGARVHFTDNVPENPAVPPMFCMLLRKKLSSGRLVNVRQLSLDRVLFLDFEVLNELSDKVILTLCVEITGHNSNIILIDQNEKIIDAIKRIGADVSSVRYVLPAVKYTLPPLQDKKNLFELSKDEVLNDIKEKSEMPLEKALLSLYFGLSPIICREMVYFATKGVDAFCFEMTESQYDKLYFYISEMKKAVYEGKCTPTMVLSKNLSPKDFSFMPILQYSGEVVTRQYESYSKLLDVFYSEKDRLARMKQKSGDLFKVVSNAIDRIERKLINQQNDLEKCKGKEKLREYGDIIYANLSSIQKGMPSVRLINFYNENASEIAINLDTKLTPAENAQKYYNEYRKADTAEKTLTQLIENGKKELLYIESVFDALSRASSENELAAIREELYAEKYIKKSSNKKAVKASLPYLKYVSSDGFLILSGRNNIQNDKLTLKDSSKGDLWLHTQKIPGSHTVIVSEGKDIPNSTIEEAAIIAAYNSKARESGKVLVDYTTIKNVKKPSGAKPGMVIYDFYKTAAVTPDSELVRKLTSK